MTISVRPQVWTADGERVLGDKAFDGWTAKEAGSSNPCRRSAALLAEVFVEIVEDRSAASEPFLVAPVRHRDASDQSLDAGGFVPSELAVLQVYVVDDFGDRLERWLGQAGVAEQHLEAAAVALMGEFGLEHVEAQLAEARRVAFARHELKPSLWVDEAPDQPRAGDAVDMHPLARHPCAILQLSQGSSLMRRAIFRFLHRGT